MFNEYPALPANHQLQCTRVMHRRCVDRLDLRAPVPSQGNSGAQHVSMKPKHRNAIMICLFYQSMAYTYSCVML